MTTANSSPSNHNWAPDYWDLFGGPAKVEDALANKARNRQTFSPLELGTDAGRAVLDQYYFAKGEHSKAGITQSILSLPNATHIVAMALPIAGLAAAIGVDYAIFGTASKDMPQSELQYSRYAFAFGSLVFASALGLAEKYNNSVSRIALYSALFVASAGASFIYANDEKFRGHFTKTLASTFTTGYDGPQKEVDALKIKIERVDKNIDTSNKTLTTGGNGGKHMLADGSRHNDDHARELIGEIKDLNKEKKDLQGKLAEALPALDQAKRKDPIDFYGRLAATGYMAAWLIAAQLLIATIVRRASDSFDQFRGKISARRRQKKLIQDLEHPDEEKRKRTTEATIKVMLSRFSEKLSLPTSNDGAYSATRQQNLTDLFQDKTYTQMVQAGTDIVYGAVIPRKRDIDLLAWVRSSGRSAFKKAATPNSTDPVNENTSPPSAATGDKHAANQQAPRPEAAHA